MKEPPAPRRSQARDGPLQEGRSRRPGLATGPCRRAGAAVRRRRPRRCRWGARGAPDPPRWRVVGPTWHRASRPGLGGSAAAGRLIPSPCERNSVNKAELVSAIAKRADVPTATVDSVLAGLQEELVDAITRGEKVAVSGLLTVERTQRSARTGRNPQTGESIDIPAANTVKVTAGSNLKKAASNVPV
ncbi:HU family DNA-binding protein [Geodermatophilus sabuli]|uniref:HU family DNA-binding protein n=1 Tax=Geodermatophilus sabuli TaxID=1564158 RepID=UPI0023BA40A9|nr:HU family DNA-binding protein [Geodermatophilus sabuli]